MSVFKNYLERLIQANTDADEQSSGSSASYLIASYPGAIGLSDGTDHYPELTTIATTGSDIVLGNDNKTISLVAGIYDFIARLDIDADVYATASLVVYFDNLPDPPFGKTNRHLLSESEVIEVSATGVVLNADIDTLLNFQVNGGGNFSFGDGQFVVRKVG